MEKKLTVVYDDKCPMCSVGMNVADSLDKKEVVDFVGMNTDRGRALIQEHKLDMNKSAYVFREDGTRTEKSRMIRDILEHNGFLGFLMSLPFRIPYLNDVLYNILAWTRWHITKSER